MWSYVGKRFYGEDLRVEPFPAGADLNYVANAPDAAKLGLGAGTYTLEAYFRGTSFPGPLAKCDFVVM